MFKASLQTTFNTIPHFGVNYHFVNNLVLTKYLPNASFYMLTLPLTAIALTGDIQTFIRLFCELVIPIFKLLI